MRMQMSFNIQQEKKHNVSRKSSNKEIKLKFLKGINKQRFKIKFKNMKKKVKIIFDRQNIDFDRYKKKNLSSEVHIDIKYGDNLILI